MVELKISLRTFKNRIKIRYPLLTITFIVVSLIIPVLIPYSDYSPLNSFSNSDQNGHSQLLNHLQKNYNVNQEHLDITKYNDPANSLIVIISPQRFFIQSEISFLEDWTDRGGYVIIGGTSPHVEDLLIDLNIEIEISSSKIVDFQSSYDNPNFVPITLETNPQTSFTAVSPLSFNFIGNQISEFEISTSSSAEKYSCVVRNGIDCEKIYTIGYIENKQNIGLFLDNWLLRNFMIETSPQNLMFLESIINKFDTGIENIIIDESHYRWAPINRKGVEVLIKNLSQSQFYPPIIFLFSVVFPLLLVLMNGNFIKTSRTDTSPVTSKLRDRIDRLYLDKILAVPLSMEEQILVEENLELNARGKYYCQFVASYYLDVIEEKELTEFMPQELVNSLNLMKHEVFDKQTAWELIKITNYYLDELIEGKKVGKR